MPRGQRRLSGMSSLLLRRQGRALLSVHCYRPCKLSPALTMKVLGLQMCTIT